MVWRRTTLSSSSISDENASGTRSTAKQQEKVEDEAKRVIPHGTTSTASVRSSVASAVKDPRAREDANDTPTMPPPNGSSLLSSSYFIFPPPGTSFPTTSTSLFTLSAQQKHVEAVKEEDLEGITEKDIQDLLYDMKQCCQRDSQHPTCQTMKKAMRYLLEGQRFAEVMNACPPSVLRVARSSVEKEHHAVVRRLFSEKLSLLYAVLPFIPTSYLYENKM